MPLSSSSRENLTFWKGGTKKDLCSGGWEDLFLMAELLTLQGVEIEDNLWVYLYKKENDGER